MLQLNKTPYLDTQILHETRDHQHLSLSPNQKILTNIQSSHTPSQNYKKLVNNVYMDQLQTSLIDFQKKKMQNKQKKKQFNQSYLHDCEVNARNLQKKQNDRKNYYQSINDQQKRRYQTFIDDSKVHEQKVKNFVESKIDPKVFHHFQQDYQITKKQYQKSFVEFLSYQKAEKQRKMYQAQNQKENQINSRLNLLNYMHEVQQKEKINKMQEKYFYKQQLDRMVNKKPQHEYKTGYQPQLRHNPITNPIEYHVENPYIVKKIIDKTNYTTIN